MPTPPTHTRKEKKRKRKYLRGLVYNPQENERGKEHLDL
jgi:hypothetical protein